MSINTALTGFRDGTGGSEGNTKEMMLESRLEALVQFLYLEIGGRKRTQGERGTKRLSFPSLWPGIQTSNSELQLCIDQRWLLVKCMRGSTHVVSALSLHYVRPPSLHNNRTLRHCTLSRSSYVAALCGSKFSGNVERKREKLKYVPINFIHSTNNKYSSYRR